MAINFLNKVDLNKNELDHARIVNEANNTAAGTGVEGQLYFDTTVDALKIWANGAWAEVGATSGVETFSSKDRTASVGEAITVNVNSIGDVTADVFAYAGGSNVGYVPLGGTVGKYLDGAGNWLDVTTGDITAVLPGTYIHVDNSTGPEPTINHDLTTRTDTTSTVQPGYGISFPAVDSVTTNTTGHVTAINVKTITIPPSDDTTYVLNTAATGVVTLDASTGTDTSVKFIGTPNEIDTTITTGANGIVQIGLPSDVTITNALTVSGAAARSSFAFQVTIPTTPLVATDAASKGYVDASNVGQSIFQGGYDAANNTPDLDVAPSNLIKKGWFWAVTDTGDFFAEEVQPGDLIYANIDNPGATYANWTVVQSGQDIAGQGASDGATTKGISGFNSAHFNVTANGWVSSDIYGGASTLGIVPSGGTNTKFLRGDGTWVIPTTVSESTVNNRLGIKVTPTTVNPKVGLAINTLTSLAVPVAGDSIPIYDLSSTTNKRVTVGDLTTAVQASTSKTGTIAIGDYFGTVNHTFGDNTMVQTIDSSGNTVYCDVTRTSTTCVATISATSLTAITILVQKIG